MQVIIDTTTKKRLSPAEESERFKGVLGYRTDPKYNLGAFGAAWAEMPNKLPETPSTKKAILSDVAVETPEGWAFQYTLEDKSEEDLELMIRGEANRRLRALASKYDEEERETWPTQVKEAEAIKAGSTDAPMLAVFAAKRGITLEQMADRVLSLAATFAAASAQIIASRDTLIAMAATPDDYAHDRWWSE